MRKVIKPFWVCVALLYTTGFFVVKAQAPGDVGTNLQMWFKANTGATASQWNDQSANANHVTQSTPANQPVLTANAFNYNPAYTFSSAAAQRFTRGVSTGLASGNANRTLVAVATFGTGSSISYIFTHGNASTLQANLFGSLANRSLLFSPFTSQLNSAASFFPVGGATPQMVFYFKNGTTEALYSKDVSVASRASLTLNTVNNILSVGSELGSSNYWNGQIAEIMEYTADVVAGSSAHDQIMSYLAVKYSIPLASNYRRSDGTIVYATDAAFANQIIGLASDVNSAFLQKQSHTPDDSFRLYVGMLATDNASNAGTITDDPAFLITGHDGALLRTTTAVSTEKPASMVSRIAREWKIVNTGFTNTFSIDLKLNVNLVNSTDLRLLVSTSSDFTSATVFNNGDNGMSIGYNAGILTISGIPNGIIPANATSYFTIASASITTPLPLQLLSFNGYAKGGNHYLNWSTAEEINTSSFDVEYSATGQQFAPVATIKATGNHVQAQDYQYIARNVKGMAYYRLKMVDNDGAAVYSRVLKVVPAQDGNYKGFTVSEVYPLPFVNTLQLSLYTNQAQTVHFRLYDLAGREVWHEQRGIAEGAGLYLLNNFAAVPEGIYTLNIATNDGAVVVRKVIKR